jgi:hypothetical protein
MKFAAKRDPLLAQLGFFGASLAHIEFFLLRVHSGQVAGNVRFSSKMTFLTPELDITPHNLV